MNKPSDEKIRICFMNSNMVWGGGEKWHYEAACHFRDLGFAVMVITNEKSALYKRLEGREDIMLHSVRISNQSFLNPFKILHIRNLLKRYDISAIFLALSIDVKLGGLAAKYAGITNIIYRRGAAVPIKNSFFNRYLFGSVLTNVITNSQDIRNKIFEKNPGIIDQSKVQIIYNGVDPELWNKQADSGDENSSQKLILGNAGRLVEQKGQKYLIEIQLHLPLFAV